MFFNSSASCGGCGNGLVAFVLAADGRSVVMFCLNCGAWYPSISLNADGELIDGADAEGPDLTIAEIGCSVHFPPARWAMPDEVRAFGCGDLLDSRYAAGHDWRPEEAPWWERRVRGEL